MNTHFLLIILSIALISSIVAVVMLLFRKKDENRYHGITAIATVLTSICTVIVGIATISSTSKAVEREILQRQPLYTVHLRLNDIDRDSFYENEEYLILNEGEKTMEKTDVTPYSFLEITYFNMNNQATCITKLCPLNRYFGANFVTGNLEGMVQYSSYSGNNNECFYRLYQDALKYGEEEPGVSIMIEKKQFFLIEYKDIFGDKHQVVKQDTSEADIKKLTEVRNQAERDAGGKSFDVFNLNLSEILATCFPEVLSNNK